MLWTALHVKLTKHSTQRTFSEVYENTQDQQRFAISHVRHDISYNQQHQLRAAYAFKQHPSTFKSLANPQRNLNDQSVIYGFSLRQL